MEEKLDVDGLHAFIVACQRCNGTQEKLVRIHLSNLGRLECDFGSKEWFREFGSRAQVSVLNHQMFQTDEMLRRDPTWRMFSQLVLLQDR